MKLLGSTKSQITKNKDSENVPHLEITEFDFIVIFSTMIISKIQEFCVNLYKPFGQLLDIPPKNLIFLKTFNSEFLYIEVWFTDQNFKPIEYL